jgi:hypothetical protein
MAPPLPLANVAGTLALSFTTGRAAPASEPPPVQTPTSVPTPPRLPPVPDETPSTPATVPSETEAGTTPTSDPSTVGAEATPAPVEPVEPAPNVAPIGPVERENPLAEDETPRARPVPAPRLLRPNHRRYAFNLFVGGSRAVRGYSPYGGSEFKAEAAIGGHDQRFRLGGFAVVQVNAGFPFTSFTFAPRLSLNRQIVPGYAFYFTTNVTLGYRLSVAPSGYGYEGDIDSDSSYDYSYDYDSGPYLMHSGMLGVSWGASAIIAERLLLSFRPLDLELVAPAPTLVQINWSVMGGVGILWGRTKNEKTRASGPSRRRRG